MTLAAQRLIDAEHPSRVDTVVELLRLEPGVSMAPTAPQDGPVGDFDSDSAHICHSSRAVRRYDEG